MLTINSNTMTGSTTVTTTAANADANSSSPFANLPTELRLQIYRLALEDIINDLLCYTYVGLACFRGGLSKHQGGFALFHTSKSIRAESVRELLSVVDTKLAKATARWMELRQTIKQEPEPSYNERKQAKAEFEYAEGMQVMLENLEEMVQKCVSKASVGEA